MSARIWRRRRWTRFEHEHNIMYIVHNIIISQPTRTKTSAAVAAGKHNVPRQIFTPTVFCTHTHTHIHNILYSFKCTWWGVAQIFNIIIIMSAQQTTRSIDYLHDTHTRVLYYFFHDDRAGSPTSWCGDDDGAEAARVYHALMYHINDTGMGYILYDCKCTRDGLVLCVINRIETRAIIIIYHYLCVRAAGETYRVM